MRKLTLNKIYLQTTSDRMVNILTDMFNILTIMTGRQAAHKKTRPGVRGELRALRKRMSRLAVVVHVELVRMRAQADGVLLLALHLDPLGDDVLGEDVALEEELVVLLEVVAGLGEAARH